MDPDLKSASSKLYPHPEDLGASRLHLRETAFLVLRRESWGWGVGERGEGTQHLPFHEDPGNL